MLSPPSKRTTIRRIVQPNPERNDLPRCLLREIPQVHVLVAQSLPHPRLHVCRIAIAMHLYALQSLFYFLQVAHGERNIRRD